MDGEGAARLPTRLRGLLEQSFDQLRRDNYRLGELYDAWMDEAIPAPNAAYAPAANTGRGDYDHAYRAIMNIIARSASAACSINSSVNGLAADTTRTPIRRRSRPPCKAR